MSDVLANGPALVAWAAVLYKLSVLRRSPDDPAARPYLWTLVALASALTVLAHPVYLTLDRLAGIPNMARLVGHGFIMLTAWSARTTLSYTTYPFEEARSRVRHHGAILVVALMFMVVLFGLAPVDEETIQFMSMYATAPFILEYWLVFLGFLGVALVDIVRLDFVYAARADNPVVTLTWKISIHTAVVAGAITILVLVFGPLLLILAPLAALVCWARVAVHDHTPAQTVAGVALGATVAAVVFSLLR